MQHAVERSGVCQSDWMTLVSLTGPLASSSRLSVVLSSLPCVALLPVLSLPAERLPTLSRLAHVIGPQARLALIYASASWHGCCCAELRWTSGSPWQCCMSNHACTTECSEGRTQAEHDYGPLPLKPRRENASTRCFSSCNSPSYSTYP